MVYDILGSAPFDIVLSIAGLLSPLDIINLRSVSTHWNRLLTNEHVCAAQALQWFHDDCDVAARLAADSASKDTESWRTVFENVLSRKYRFGTGEITSTVDLGRDPTNKGKAREARCWNAWTSYSHHEGRQLIAQINGRNGKWFCVKDYATGKGIFSIRHQNQDSRFLFRDQIFLLDSYVVVLSSRFDTPGLVLLWELDRHLNANTSDWHTQSALATINITEPDMTLKQNLIPVASHHMSETGVGHDGDVLVILAFPTAIVLFAAEQRWFTFKVDGPDFERFRAMKVIVDTKKERLMFLYNGGPRPEGPDIWNVQRIFSETYSFDGQLLAQASHTGEQGLGIYCLSGRLPGIHGVHPVAVRRKLGPRVFGPAVVYIVYFDSRSGEFFENPLHIPKGIEHVETWPSGDTVYLYARSKNFTHQGNIWVVSSPPGSADTEKEHCFTLDVSGHSKTCRKLVDGIWGHYSNEQTSWVNGQLISYPANLVSTALIRPVGSLKMGLIFNGGSFSGTLLQFKGIHEKQDHSDLAST